MMVLVASAVVKPNADQAFAEQFERHLFPSLQVQPGFRGEIVLVSPGAPEVILITFWDSDANARSYERSAWPESVKTLTNILNPAVFRRFQLAHSTLHPEGVATFPMQSPITTEPTGVVRWSPGKATGWWFPNPTGRMRHFLFPHDSGRDQLSRLADTPCARQGCT